MEGQSRRANEISLAAATTTEEETLDAGVRLAQGLRYGEKWADVTARPSADQENAASVSRTGLDQR